MTQPQPESLLTVEVSAEGDEVCIFGDTRGLGDLLKAIAWVLRNEDHEHLKTASWGGGELSEVAQQDGSTLVHHLVVQLVKP